ncbi:MAG: sulfatase-like hydrolase/transferase [Bacillota bacterium]
MKNKNQSQIYFFYVGAFFVLNILNTYMLTVQGLNRYIAPFKHTFQGEINAILGNFGVLLIILLCAFFFTHRAKGRMIFLLVTTFLLNIFIFVLGVFNLYFGTSFSMKMSSLVNNPSDGFAGGTILLALLELVTYWRIVVFLPFIMLLIIYLLSDRKEMKTIYFNIPIKQYLIGVLSTVLVMFVAVFSYFQQYKVILPINAVKSTFAVQNLGVYPYYIGEFLGQPFDIDLQSFLDLEDEENLASAFQEYNRNQTSYVNFFDGNTYSNRLTTDQAVDDLFVDDSIAQGTNLQGILEGKNIVLVHIESMNHFLFENEYTNERLVFYNQIMSQSFVFNNFYSNVGMGVSSDGELSVLTGLYPMGDRVLYWEYDDIEYDLNTLAKYFNMEGYYTKAIHGDKETFYNRNVVYPAMMEFDEFYSLEDYIKDGYSLKEGYIYNTENNLVHISPWVSDYLLADTVSSVGSSFSSINQSFLLFPITMMPHTPFEYDPNGMRQDIYPQYVNLIQNLTLKYINYADYYDDTMKRFFVNDQNEDQTLDNTVYVFYSDHGSGLKNGDLDIFYDRDLGLMETRKILQQIVSFIYVPGEEFIDYGDYQLRKGLLTGEQNLVRSEVDLYRTIIELFNLPVENDVYYGVNGLSTEPTFAMDNRLMDVATDDYFFSLRDREKIFPETAIVSDAVYDYIVRFKLLSDLIVSKGNMQVQIDEAVDRFYG